MLDFEQKLVETALAHSVELFAWNLLPNHYRLLLATLDVKRFPFGPALVQELRLRRVF